MVIDYRNHTDMKMERFVHLVEINPNDWYCWAKYPDGYIHPVPEDVFFRDFGTNKKSS
ncbi:hypothetical protein ACT7DA_23355 [Bacillus pacificus]